MQAVKFPKTVPLTGADKFILALESSGRPSLALENVCIYRLGFTEDFLPKTLMENLAQNEVLCYLSSLRLSGRSNNFNCWRAKRKSQPEIITVHTEADLAKVISSPPFDLFRRAPLRLVISDTADGPALYLVWHHLLMDGQGAHLLLKHLNGAEIQLLAPRSSSRFNWKNLLAAREAKRYIKQSAKGHIQSVESEIYKDVLPVAHFHTFSADQVIALKEKARADQAKFGLGNYLLALCARAVHRTFHDEKPLTYWVPIPQDTRRKNASGPLLGNQLSFLFYRLEMTAEMNNKELVAQLDTQMMSQIRDQIPLKYGHLLNFMRRFNPRWYHRLLTGPSGTMLTSFLYTYAPEQPQGQVHFQGAEVSSSINLPPNSYPPGLTFSVHTCGDEMTLHVQSYSHLLDDKRTRVFNKEIAKLILQAE